MGLRSTAAESSAVRPDRPQALDVPARPPAITLTGYLRKDRETKTTATQTETRTFTQYNPVIDGDEEREVEITRGGRDYLLLNLASHRGTGANRTTIWHTLVVWNPDRSGVSGARLARKGDCVTVTGSPETYRYIDSNGEQRALHRFVVESFSFKSLKARQEIP